MNLVISMPKTGKAYSKKIDEPVFLYKKIGDEVSLDEVGLAGYKAKITGGSDRDGFPMKKSLVGSSRKKTLVAKGTGFTADKQGERRRITLRGNTVDEDIHQVNLMVTTVGSADIDAMLGKKPEEKVAEGEGSAEEKGEKEKK